MLKTTFQCPLTQICSKKHLEEHHQILIPTYKELQPLKKKLKKLRQTNCHENVH